MTEQRVAAAEQQGGLLINGEIVPVPGVSIIGSHDAEWAHLSPGDCRPRRLAGALVYPHLWQLHKTLADDPEVVLPGRGPAGGARRTAAYWQGDPKHSGAHLVTGHDGETACLADLVLVEAYHATVSNLWAVGHETCELVGGKVYEAALDAAVRVCLAGCRAIGIQLQVPKLGSYRGHPHRRMLDGGRTVVGIVGHRDNTEDRGRWDPGDLLFEMLVAAGCEQFDLDSGEDLRVWQERQRELNRHGHRLVVDGIPGRKTTAALKAEGYVDGIYALGRG